MRRTRRCVMAIVRSMYVRTHFTWHMLLWQQYTTRHNEYTPHIYPLSLSLIIYCTYFARQTQMKPWTYCIIRCCLVAHRYYNAVRVNKSAEVLEPFIDNKKGGREARCFPPGMYVTAIQSCDVPILTDFGWIITYRSPLPLPELPQGL